MMPTCTVHAMSTAPAEATTTVQLSVQAASQMHNSADRFEGEK